MTYFVSLKNWFLFLLYSLFSSENPFNFLGVLVERGGGGGGFYIFNVPRGEGFNDFKWNPTGGEGGQEDTILKGASKMYSPYNLNLKKKLKRHHISLPINRGVFRTMSNYQFKGVFS